MELSLLTTHPPLVASHNASLQYLLLPALLVITTFIYTNVKGTYIFYLVFFNNRYNSFKFDRSAKLSIYMYYVVISTRKRQNILSILSYYSYRVIVCELRPAAYIICKKSV